MNTFDLKRVSRLATWHLGALCMLALNCQAQYPYPTASPTNGGSSMTSGGSTTGTSTSGGTTGGGSTTGTPASGGTIYGPTGGGSATGTPTGGGTIYGPMGGGSAGGGSTLGSASSSGLQNTYHVNFDRPEAWALKYFASATLLTGLQPAEPVEGLSAGAITVGFEVGWLPSLDAGQQRVGYNGTSPENLNQAPVLIRPMVRVKLPDNFTLIAAGPPPLSVFGLTPHLLAFGVEHPIFEGNPWSLRWRGYGQLGSVKGAFTCPASVLAFAPGSAGNPTQCIAPSADVATLRYAGAEIDAAYRIPSMPRVIPHVTADGNFIDGAIQLHAPTAYGLDQTRMWTHGGTFSTSGGVSYLVSKRATFTVDAFYTPLWVRRTATAPVTNDGLFNVRALMTYTFR